MKCTCMKLIKVNTPTENMIEIQVNLIFTLDSEASEPRANCKTANWSMYFINHSAFLKD